MRARNHAHFFPVHRPQAMMSWNRPMIIANPPTIMPKDAKIPVDVTPIAVIPPKRVMIPPRAFNIANIVTPSGLVFPGGVPNA